MRALWVVVLATLALGGTQPPVMSPPPAVVVEKNIANARRRTNAQ